MKILREFNCLNCGGRVVIWEKTDRRRKFCSSRCCQNYSARKSYRENPQKIIEQNLRHYYKNREKYLAYRKEYYRKNREEILAWNKKLRQIKS